MSDEKSDEKPDKLFFDEKSGILHGSECPKTKKEFHEEGGSDDCQFEKDVAEAKKVVEAIMKLPAPELDSFRGREATVSVDKNGRTSIGPAQVATRTYRENWETIFGTRPTVGKA